MKNSNLKIIQAALEKKKLIIIFGTGLSNSLTNGTESIFTWQGLIDSALLELQSLRKITPAQLLSWSELAKSNDIDEVLGAAEFISRKFEAPQGDLYARWLEEAFSNKQPKNNELVTALRELKDAGAVLATLNYDTLIESAVGASSVTMTSDSLREIRSWMEGDQSILHLHGVWSKPTSCIFGIRDYHNALNDETRSLIQRALLAFSTIVFVGCGATFEDPNFSTMTSWLRKELKGQGGRHYILVRESEYESRKAEVCTQGFADPLVYGTEYRDLSEFIKKIAEQGKKSGVKTSFDKAPEVEDYSDILARYRSFILKDCGQMTIEGLRADMDTAQRKFDIEKLFVPLTVAKVPPAFSETDPDRDKKLKEWISSQGQPRPFGMAMSESTKLALLALPGGGKTLLLKRLAVAYADIGRRDASGDNLPNDELIPVLIRCREWRAEIRKPIAKIIEAIPDQAGEVDLHGFSKLVDFALRHKTLLLLIDGLDEIHDDADRIVFVENLEKYIEANSQIKLIVTSREAGFDLVAPSLTRFCARYRVSPLSEQSITDLCKHWHRLMAEDASTAEKESSLLVEQLLHNSALRRLAENPLLLTMLLVVKHGAGRLPPDRVSLYERAVDVLVDTWNIKGHAPLGLKEAVPQLACIAYEMMKNGTQTATRADLIKILERARVALPQLGRYSRDSPDEFLKRVELRSSLLLEGGRVAQGRKTVPFYQFRHLTFQEYLAALAAAEGLFIGYKQGDDILIPLKPHIESSEWKEVIPMAAVLSKKQADPLIKEIISRAKKIADDFFSGKGVTDSDGKRIGPDSPPFLIRQLIRCVVEEVEINPEDVAPVMRLIALFARGCRSKDDWAALAEGPYGEDLLNQSISLYKAENIKPEMTWIRNTVCAVAALREGLAFLESPAGKLEIAALLNSGRDEDLIKGLTISLGLFWLLGSKEVLREPPFDKIKFIRWSGHSEAFVVELALWAWGLQHSISEKDNDRIKSERPSQSDAVRLVECYFRFIDKPQVGIVDFSMIPLLLASRGTYTIILNRDQVLEIKEKMDLFSKIAANHLTRDGRAAVWIIGYLSGKISDRTLKKNIGFLLNVGVASQHLVERVRKEFGIVSKKKARTARNVVK